MARELNDKDQKILRKLVPEFEDLLRQQIELDYLNILPPVANHHAKDLQDFRERLNRLSSEDLSYLAEKVIDGSESLGCLYPEYAEAFFDALKGKSSQETVDKARAAYEIGGECGD